MPRTRMWLLWWDRWRREAARRWGALPAQRRATWRFGATSALVGLVVALLAVAVAGPWDSGQRAGERERAAEAVPGAGHEDHRPPPEAVHAPPVLAPLGRAAGAGTEAAAPAPTRAGLDHALSHLLKDPALGSVRSASVVDVASGRQVFGSHPDATATPASTIKLGTAVAALTRLGPDHRITTRVVAGPAKGGAKGARPIVLVGGGDPTLTARPAHASDGADRPANLRTLATATARALRRAGTTRVTLGYDTSAYSGPATHPIGPNDNIAKVTPLMADEARTDGSDHGPAPRDPDPAAAATRSFAGFLRSAHITVDGAAHAHKAPAADKEIAAVRSLPLSAIVERMETNSDNDIAEALARQTAMAAHQPVSFAGGGRAVRGTLAGLHLPLHKAAFADGSGLDREDHVSASLLSHLLLLAASPDHPGLRPVASGLPVAGFSGTLSTRYSADGPAAAGTGAVRAKTGTLTGVNSLAGTVVDGDGRLMTFAFMTGDAPAPVAAEQALDRLAASLAGCGCH